MAKSLIEQLPKVAKEGWRVVASMIDSLDAKITGVAYYTKLCVNFIR